MWLKFEFANLILYFYLFNLSIKSKVTVKRSNLKLIALLFIFQFLIMPNSFLVYSKASTLEINPEFGNAPQVDGDLSDDAWDDAFKTTINLTDLSTDLWVMQADSHLYIALSFNLFIDIEKPFLGIFISNSSSQSISYLKDAKILQHTNLSTGDYNFLDYNINNNIFSPDSEINGNGATKNITDDWYYEFSIPLYCNDQEDVNLKYDQSYGFNITWGYPDSYPGTDKGSAFVIINIQTPTPPAIDPIELSLLIIAIVVSCITGAFLGLYLVKIPSLKKKIKRVIR